MASEESQKAPIDMGQVRARAKPTEIAEEKEPTPRPVAELMAQMAYEYQQQENDWRLLRGRDRAGHTDTFIQGPVALYQMKTELKNPFQHIGVGMRFPNPRTEGLPGGRRPNRAQERLFTPRTLEPLFSGEPFPFQEVYPRLRHDPDEQTISLETVVSAGIGAHSQPATDKLRHLISAQQDNLQARLDRELNKLTRKHDMFKEFG